MEEVFEHWLERNYPALAQRVQAESELTEEESQKLRQYHTTYIAARTRNFEQAYYSYSGPSQRFKDWLRATYVNYDALSPETIHLLAEQFHRAQQKAQGLPLEEIAYDAKYQRIMVNGEAHYFDRTYFPGFKYKDAYIVKPNHLKDSINPEVRDWPTNEGKCLHPNLDPLSPYVDFAGDIYRSLNIVVETKENDVRIFKKIHAIANDKASIGNYGNKHNVVSESEAENVANNNNNTDEALQDVAEDSKPPARNYARLEKVYADSGLESYGVTFATFSRVMKAYYQALLYKLSNVIARILPRGFTLYGQEQINSTLVFCLDGKAYLDLYGPDYQLQCDKINTEEGYLRIPFSTAAFFRFPFSEQHGAFTHPFLICDKEFAALLTLNAFPISVPNVKLPKGKRVVDLIQEMEKQLELVGEVQTVIGQTIEKNGEGQIKLAPMQGEHKNKIIAGTAAGSFLTVLVACLACVPGGQLPSALIALGFSGELVASVVAAVAASGAASGVFTGVAAGIYAWWRGTHPQEFEAIELNHVVPSVELRKAGLAELSSFIFLTQDFEEELVEADDFGFVAVVVDRIVPQRRLSETDFFETKASLRKRDVVPKGKEEADAVESDVRPGRSHSAGTLGKNI